ncbi:2'-5' RNA ligase family protein [Streptomyces fradiae]|uniref:2'-5' RNA ligase family protein n=1 Tax=Streptomyces fradiae TaxID=1906 RepID=UPI003987C4E4
MDTFFTPSKIWPGGGPYPHFLILLDRYPEYREFARAHADLLAAHGHLGVIPEQWLHITVQGIHHLVSGEQVEALRGAARRELAGMRSFTVQLGPTWPGVTGITAAVYPEDGMAELNQRTRAACDAVPGIVLRPEEARFWPHTTLAYANPRELHQMGAFALVA